MIGPRLSAVHHARLALHPAGDAQALVRRRKPRLGVYRLLVSHPNVLEWEPRSIKDWCVRTTSSPSTIYGNAKRGTGILNNELYVGRLVSKAFPPVKSGTS